MNPVVKAIISQLIPIVETAIAAEGPIVLKFLQDELLKLEQKYVK